MSLDKAIKYGKEHRKEYRGAKAIYCSCRNHGSCSWCEANRRYQALKEEIRTLDELDEYDKDAIYDLLGYKTMVLFAILIITQVNASIKRKRRNYKWLIL